MPGPLFTFSAYLGAVYLPDDEVGNCRPFALLLTSAILLWALYYQRVLAGASAAEPQLAGAGDD